MSDLVSQGLPQLVPTEGIGTTDFTASFAVHLPTKQIRVSFPVGVVPTLSGPGLIPSNYIITGPLNPTVYAVSVSGPYLLLNVSDHTPGASYTVAIPANGIFYNSTSALPVTLGYIAVKSAFNSGGAVEGLENDDAYQVLKKVFNPTYTYLGQKNWDALLWAISYGDQSNWDNSKKAFNQLFTSSASGVYLDRLGRDHGVQKPKYLGLSDYNYRNLIIKNYTNKLTEISVNDILEVFYGEDSLKANIISTSEPYALSDGDNLILKLNNKDLINIYFSTDDFSSIGSAKAIEVAAVITKQMRDLGILGYAVQYVDVNGNKKIKIYSSALGLSSRIEVLGGKAQNALKFPTELNLYSGVNPPTWNITIQPNNRVRFTTATSPTGLDLSNLQEGDYVNIYGTEFNNLNRGTFLIKNVSIIYPGPTQYFEIENASGTAQSVAQLTSSSIRYFRPTVYTTFNSSYYTYVSQTSNSIDVVIPATSIIINREEYTGSYLQPTTIKNITNLTKISNGTVTITSNNHGLSVNDQIFVESVSPTISYPAVTTGTSTTTDYSYMTLSQNLTAANPGFTANIAKNQTFVLNDNRVLIAGGTPDLNDGSDDCYLFKITNTTNPVPGKIQHTYSWTTDTVLPTSVGFGAGCKISNGYPGAQVVLTGGQAVDPNVTSNVYVYVPGLTTGTWVSLNTFTTSRRHHRCIQLNNNKLMICGGDDGTVTPINSTQLGTFAGSNVTWASGANMKTARFSHEIITLDNGKILAVGGYGAGSAILNSCELYDPTGDTWTTTGQMTYSRVDHALVKIGNNVLAIGGTGMNNTTDSATQYIADIEMYDANLGVWYPFAKLPWGVTELTASYWPETNKVYIIGRDGDLRKILVLDLNNGRIDVLFNIEINRVHVAGPVIPGKGILVISGRNQDFDGFDEYCFILPNSEQIASQLINEFKKVVSTPDGNTFTYNSEGNSYQNSSSGTFIAMKAGESQYAGPYVVDPVNNFIIYENKTTLNQNIGVGQNLPTLTLTDVTQLPDNDGYIIINYGYDNQIGPIKYFGHSANNKINIDFNFTFSQNISSGATVRLAGHGAYTGSMAEIGGFYITDTPIGRVTAEKIIVNSTAEGIDKNISVSYPGDRGLGGEGYGTSGNGKLSDIVECFDTDKQV